VLVFILILLLLELPFYGLHTAIHSFLRTLQHIAIPLFLDHKAPLEYILKRTSFENHFPSPDRNGNPFAFSFKKQKIGVNSGNSS